jgi:hypothetical protein
MSALRVRKYGAHIQMSREMLVGYGLVEPTPEEQAKIDASRADVERRRAAATAAWPGFVAALNAVTEPVARAVLDLHANVDQMCAGCEFGGYEAERPSWPCATTDAIATALGIDVPPDLWMAEQARV